MATITLRMDDAVKQAFEAACEDMGIPMNVAFTVFAKRVVRDRRIPFEIKADPEPFYSERNIGQKKRISE